MHHVRAARARDGSFAFIYTPTGRLLGIDLRKLSGERVIAHDFDPREGK
jgi:hypothetical protein